MASGRRLVGIGDLAGEVMNILSEFTEACTEDVKKAAVDVAKDAKKKLQSNSPEGKGSRKGHYKDGWTYSVEKDSAYQIGVTVHNKKKPGLTHLLEKGHAKRGGGRVEGNPHIEPVENYIVTEYEKKLRERIGK